MIALVLLELSNKLMKNDEMLDCRAFYRFFATVNINTEARMIDSNSVYHMALK